MQTPRQTTEIQSTAGECPMQMVCHCLQVTEQQILSVMSSLEITCPKEVGKHTGAGEGCTACRTKLAQLVEEFNYGPASSSALAICSVK